MLKLITQGTQNKQCILKFSTLNLFHMERHDRIAKAIAASGKRKGEIAAACGVANSAVTQWISGESKGIKPENLYALAAATGFRAEWIAIGEGLERADEPLPGSPSEKDYALIPQYTAKAAAGNGFHNDHIELKEGLVFKRDWLKRLSLKEENLCVIYAEGSSMEPTISDGDVLLIDRSSIQPRNGKVYAIQRPDGSHSIKRLVQSFTGDWLIRSDNTDKTLYPDEPISSDDLQQIEIIGRSVWGGGGM
jgi:phage repressor protein C with HTH and peptisase S24 domain